jgi:hypothetical protein
MRFRDSQNLRLALPILVVLYGLCQGCVNTKAPPDAKGSTPVPLDATLRNLAVDLSSIDVLNPSDLLVDEASATIRMRDLIANAQCYDIDSTTGLADPAHRTINPLIPISTGAMQLTVQGQLSEAGSVTVSITPSIGGTITRQGQQQFMFPLTLVSLQNYSTFYIGQQLTNLQYATLLSTFKDPDKQVSERENLQTP